MHTYFNEWGATNNIVVLYPQGGGFAERHEAAPSAQLGGECWDGYGQTGIDYAVSAFSSSPLRACRARRTRPARYTPPPPPPPPISPPVVWRPPSCAASQHVGCDWRPITRRATMHAAARALILTCGAPLDPGTPRCFQREAQTGSSFTQNQNFQGAISEQKRKRKVDRDAAK
jgi:hypothetical protein